MWRIEEHRRVDMQLDSAPREILKRYEKWKDIAVISGPPGSKGFTMKPGRASGPGIAPLAWG